MNFTQVFSKMIVILVTMVIGYGTNRLGYLTGETNGKLCKLILNVTLPAMILSTVLTGDTLPAFSEIMSVLQVTAVFYIMEGVLMLLVPKLLGGTAGEKGVWRFSLAFPNVGFVGYPVNVALFGPGALFYAVIVALPFNVLSFTTGPLMLVGPKKVQWKKLISPCAICAVLGLVIALARIRLPAIIGECTKFVGDVTVPLSLILMGSLLAGLPVRRVLGSFRMWMISILRLLVMPALLFLILRNFNLPDIVLGVAVMQMSTPVAVNGTMLSMEHGGDTETIAQVTFLTTLLSIITIPMVALLIL